MDAATVEKIALLARLSLEPGEAAARAPQLSAILGFVEQLSVLDTAGLEPLASPTGALATPERADVVSDGALCDSILANAPQAKAGFFVVPKVIEQEE